ncbi:hypothetical protein QQF64_018431 [Cirrhinus molitorella]|uniref:Endonuclease/exonuclease/phosphatase domain-containing protein n=1 Tax=Cirrhinus molitorella TaxID=172907 RepID=A0ABR3LE19_9TELE
MWATACPPYYAALASIRASHQHQHIRIQQFTGYKPQLSWHRAWRQGLPPASSWAAPRQLDSGTLKEKDYTFYWQGKAPDEHRQHGVAFAVKNSLLSMVEPGSNGSERLLTFRLNTTTGPLTFVNVYAPTLNATLETKDQFYENLTSVINSIPNKEQLILLGDFNARVGADNDSWPSCLGKFGVCKMNENGQHLLELCAFHNLCIANSYFQTKPQHKVSCVLQDQAEPKEGTRKQGNPRIDVSKMSQPDLTQKFAEALEKELDAIQTGDSALEKWETLRNTMHRTALATFGKRTTKTHDWFEAKSSVMIPVIEAKRRLGRIQAVTKPEEPSNSQGY